MAGSLPNGHRESDSLGAPVDGRRFGQRKPHPLTGRRWNRSSVPRRRPASADRDRGATGSVRGPSPASRAVENAAARQRCPDGRRSSSPSREGVVEAAEAGGATSIASHLGSDHRKAVRRRSSSSGSRPSGCAVSSAKAARSGIGRFTGARVESRMQRSDRSIFLLRSRRAERRTERTRGSAARRHRTPTGRGHTAASERVRGAEHANDK